MTLLSERFRVNRKNVWALTVFVILCFYMVGPVNVYLAESLKKSYYMLVVPLLVGAVLYFRRLQDGLEFKFLVGYLVWLWFTRVLNGSPALDKDFQLLFDLTLMLPFFALGLALNSTERRRFLDWLCAVVGGFYFLVGVFCLIAFLQHRMYINPITEQNIGLGSEANFNRINIFDIHANITGCWYLMALFLMIYEFFACRNKLWRIPILLSAAVDYLVIAVSYSRGDQMSAAVAFGLLVVLFLKRLKRPKGGLRIFLLLVGFAVTFLFSYRLFGMSADGLNYLSNTMTHQKSTSAELSTTAETESAAATVLRMERPSNVSATALAEIESEDMPKWEKTDPREWNGSLNLYTSNRLVIWKGALDVLKDEPDILLRGRLSENIMDAANLKYPFSVEVPHMHNSILQILFLTGIPGVLLALGMIGLLIFHCVRLFITESPEVSMAEKTMVFPVIATWAHFLTEAALFTTCDVRTLLYFLLCGMALGFCREAGV